MAALSELQCGILDAFQAPGMESMELARNLYLGQAVCVASDASGSVRVAPRSPRISKVAMSDTLGFEFSVLFTAWKPGKL